MARYRARPEVKAQQREYNRAYVARRSEWARAYRRAWEDRRLVDGVEDPDLVAALLALRALRRELVNDATAQIGGARVARFF
jgi:hypothetical protein